MAIIDDNWCNSFNNGPDGLSITPCLKMNPTYLKEDQSTSKFHVPTLLDKLKLVNYSRSNTKNFEVQILVGKFDDSTSIH